MINFDKFSNDFLAQFVVDEPIIIESGTKFRDLDDWDSLTGMAIIAMIEDDYKVKITDPQFKSFVTVGDVYEFVVKAQGEESKN